MAAKGTHPQSYVAIDELMFVQDKPNCPLFPPEAQPPDGPTTPNPTEPPNGNFVQIVFLTSFAIVFTFRYHHM